MKPIRPISVYSIVNHGDDMKREIRVLLTEDDFYARSWMEMILRRDLRTRVVREVNGPIELSTALDDMHNHRVLVDMVIIDTDVPGDQRWLADVLRNYEKSKSKAAILLTGCAPNPRIATLKTLPHFAGYVLKGEICYSLAWAVSFANEGRMVITPGVLDLFGWNVTLPPGSMILDGRRPIANLSKSDSERARMAFIFSMERHELAHELGISEDFSYGVVSALYDKMGLDDVLEGMVSPEVYFGSHPAVIDYLTRTLTHMKRTGSKKAKNKETLAFHLFTMPEIQEVC